MKSKKILIILLVIIGCIALGWSIIRTKIGPIHIPQKEKPAETAIKESGRTVEGLTVPQGFRITYFREDVPGARVMVFDQKGRMLVSETKNGAIAVLEDMDGNGVAENNKILVKGLKNPHGMAWKCGSECFLYVAESDALSRFSYDANTATVSGKTKLIDISYSSSDRHFTRSLAFLPAPHDNILLISVGSSCDVCNEKDTEHGKILSYNVGSGKLEEYARGLRNAVFITLNPLDGKVFATEMGRDSLGDNIPPDEINIIEREKNYGWPICYGRNIHDASFDKNTYIRNPCMAPFETESFVDLAAHSAPLGLSFIPEEGWNDAYWHDLLVAYHGSWNRSVPTGYKIVRIKMNAKGEYEGTEDFITGWLTKEGKTIGRPADVKAMPGGTVYISDDSRGAIYKLSSIEE